VQNAKTREASRAPAPAWPGAGFSFCVQRGSNSPIRGRMTEPEPLQQVDRTFVRFRKRKLSYFSGCDYFRMASHPQVMAAMQAGLKQYGLNVAASRLTTGNHPLYPELEQRLKEFFTAEDALLVSSGYMTNLVVAQALARSFSHALIDEQSHPSLADATRFLDCPVVQFKHCDAEDVARAVRRCGPKAKLILLTDGMFSRDGSAAPLDRYRKLLPKDATILVDDAHGGGVLGATGQGTLEQTGVSRRRIIQTVTLSKAFGAFGGAILGTPELRQRILDYSHSFVGSTPVPLPLANAALQGLKLLKTDPGFRRRLVRNAAYVKDTLRAAGFAVPETPGPIAMLPPQPERETVRLRRDLLAAGIFPPFIKYPGGPASGYFRFVISSEHTKAQLDAVVKAVLGARK
jgi:7-keto-8-aminopelargonate synthetase-like enzyme